MLACFESEWWGLIIILDFLCVSSFPFTSSSFEVEYTDRENGSNSCGNFPIRSSPHAPFFHVTSVIHGARFSLICGQFGEGAALALRLAHLLCGGDTPSRKTQPKCSLFIHFLFTAAPILILCVLTPRTKTATMTTVIFDNPPKSSVLKKSRQKSHMKNWQIQRINKSRRNAKLSLWHLGLS